MDFPKYGSHPAKIVWSSMNMKWIVAKTHRQHLICVACTLHFMHGIGCLCADLSLHKPYKSKSQIGSELCVSVDLVVCVKCMSLIISSICESIYMAAIRAKLSIQMIQLPFLTITHAEKLLNLWPSSCKCKRNANAGINKIEIQFQVQRRTY